MEVDKQTLLLSSPFTMLCAGATSSGKTFFIKTLIENIHDIVTDVPKKILYCYGTYQDIFEQMKSGFKNINFIQGIPSKQTLDEISSFGASLVILDDLMSDVYNSKDMLHLFTQYSHHNNISVIFTSQNLYHGGKFGRTITLNCHYLVLFKNYNLAQMRFLGQSLFPGISQGFLQIYKDALKQKYGYLFIDLHPSADAAFMLRSQIVPSFPMYVYQTTSFNSKPSSF